MGRGQLCILQSQSPLCLLPLPSCQGLHHHLCFLKCNSIQLLTLRMYIQCMWRSGSEDKTPPQLCHPDPGSGHWHRSHAVTAHSVSPIPFTVGRLFRSFQLTEVHSFAKAFFLPFLSPHCSRITSSSITKKQELCI